MQLESSTANRNVNKLTYGATHGVFCFPSKDAHCQVSDVLEKLVIYVQMRFEIFSVKWGYFSCVWHFLIEVEYLRNAAMWNSIGGFMGTVAAVQPVPFGRKILQKKVNFCLF